MWGTTEALSKRVSCSPQQVQASGALLCRSFGEENCVFCHESQTFPLACALFYWNFHSLSIRWASASVGQLSSSKMSVQTVPTGCEAGVVLLLFWRFPTFHSHVFTPSTSGSTYNCPTQMDIRLLFMNTVQLLWYFTVCWLHVQEGWLNAAVHNSNSVSNGWITPPNRSPI